MNLAAAPPYPYEHSGPCLVVGNAFTMAADLIAARAIFGDAPVLAVNGAAAELRADFLYTKHPGRYVEHGYDWIARQRGFHDGFTVHGSRFHADMPWVGFWWERARGRGGSAWGGRKVAALLGLKPVILVGCPLVPGEYARHKPGMLMTVPSVVEAYAREIASDTAWHEGCFSMSGRTREILGPPC